MKTACDEARDIFLNEIAPAIKALGEEFTWTGFFSLLEDAIKAVEKVMGAGNGPQKKACVLDIITDVYDQYEIDIPYLPNMFEKMALKWILDVAIDAIVELLNKNGIFVHGAVAVPASG